VRVQLLNELVGEVEVWLEEEDVHGLVAQEDEHSEGLNLFVVGIGARIDVDHGREDVEILLLLLLGVLSDSRCSLRR